MGRSIDGLEFAVMKPDFLEKEWLGDQDQKSLDKQGS
jgi:hypothetical protein